ncbi:keratin, type II cytoskeletal 2 epidermal [Diprion similis]|uniref:keratin, type II cytoskeletal 2 epidermal n=1 Tax=Diprion similis TaxID=362088 RepID=UPI001EF87F8B|nr:keratin, type II cytoskeletal 2 epidermal [Diprion similis]
MKLLAVLLVAAVASAQTLDDCLQQDAISCVQKSFYHRVKQFFDQDKWEIVRGVSLVKSQDSRGAKSSDDVIYDQEIEGAKSSVAERQNSLENFVTDKISGFVSGRSLQINFSPMIEQVSNSARALTESVPEEVSQAVDEVVEGRGKKKILKSILPLLLAAKLKIGALATLAYFGIALLAKKAIIASLISIAISAFIGFKALMSQGHDHHSSATAYNSGGWSSGGGGGWSSGGGGGGGGWSSGGSPGGWSSSGGSGGWEDRQAAQSQAYSGYQH